MKRVPLFTLPKENTRPRSVAKVVRMCAGSVWLNWFLHFEQDSLINRARGETAHAWLNEEGEKCWNTVIFSVSLTSLLLPVATFHQLSSDFTCIKHKVSSLIQARCCNFLLIKLWTSVSFTKSSYSGLQGNVVTSFEVTAVKGNHSRPFLSQPWYTENNCSKITLEAIEKSQRFYFVYPLGCCYLLVYLLVLEPI